MKGFKLILMGAIILLFVSCVTKVKDKKTIISNSENTTEKIKEVTKYVHDTIKITETITLPSESIIEYRDIYRYDSISRRLNYQGVGYFDILIKEGTFIAIQKELGGSKTETNTSHNEQNSIVDSTKLEKKEFKEIVKKAPYIPKWVFISIGLNILFIIVVGIAIKSLGFKTIIKLIFSILIKLKLN